MGALLEPATCPQLPAALLRPASGSRLPVRMVAWQATPHTAQQAAHPAPPSSAAARYRLVVEESYSFGVLGPNGRGAAEHFGLKAEQVGRRGSGGLGGRWAPRLALQPLAAACPPPCRALAAAPARAELSSAAARPAAHRCTITPCPCPCP